MKRKRSLEPVLTYLVGADSISHQWQGGKDPCRYHTWQKADIYSKCSADGILVEAPGKLWKLTKHPNKVIYSELTIARVSATTSCIWQRLKGRQGSEKDL